MAVQELFAKDLQQKSKGHLSRAWARLIRKKVAVACMVVLAIIYVGGIFAPLVAPYGYTDQDYRSIKKPPSWDHLAGTDLKGRDVLTRVLWGIQNTVIITLVVMGTGGIVIGVTLGLVSGYFRRKIDAVIMRVGELFSSFPDIFLMILIAATLRPRILEWVRWLEDNTVVDGIVKSGIVDYFAISIALVSFSWIGMARLVRGQVLALMQTQFVESAQAVGASTPRILFVHLLPNAISPVVVTVSMGMGALVGTEIILSFLGLGIQPPTADWGSMVRDNATLINYDDITPLLPAAAIAILTVAVNFVVDWLLHRSSGLRDPV